MLLSYERREVVAPSITPNPIPTNQPRPTITPDCCGCGARVSAAAGASLQAADGSERIGFADLEQLAAFLLRLADGRALPDGAELDGPIDDGN